ncbi:MAG: Lrp/AsnC family transcriptional regulator [Inquilinaceae bacterium]
MQAITLDDFDLRILAAVQTDGRRSNVVLSETVPLSPSQIQRRTRRLEQAGLIAGYVALLDPRKLGLGVMAFTSVSLAPHGPRAARAFADAIAGLDAVQECHSVSGDADYLLRIVAPDLRAFADFMMHSLMTLEGVISVKSNIVLEPIKSTTSLPLAHLATAARKGH